MQAVRELQRQLAEAQAVSNVKRISERNCIDLLQKLIQTERVKLIHTTSGKEWLTPDQLEREIREALTASGGRLHISEVPAKVGVGIEHCEARVDAMRQRDRSLIRLQGELLSVSYLQSAAHEIEEALQGTGCVAVADLAGRYNLPADFIRDSLLELVTASTSHVLKHNIVYTGAYASQVDNRVCEELTSCDQPVMLPQFAARHGLVAEMVIAAAQKCVNEGLVQGKLQGPIFTPKSFSEGQAARVDTFFDANGYLPFTLAKSSGVIVKDWIQSKQLEGVTLSTAFLAAHLVESALAPICEAVSSESCVDVQPLLPPSLTAGDARDFLQYLANEKRLPEKALVLDRVVLSHNFVTSLADHFDADVKAAAENGLANPSGKAGRKVAPSHAEDGEDDGVRKKGKKGPRAKKGRGDDDETAAGAGGGSTESRIDDQRLCEVFADQFPELPTEVYEELCGHLQPILATLVAETQAALCSSAQSKQKALFEQAEKFAQEKYEILVLGLRALASTGTQDSPLYAYLLKETVVEPLHRLLGLRWVEVNGASIEVTTTNRKQCLDKLVATQGAAQVDSLTRFAAVLSKGKEDKEPVKEARDAKETRGKKGKRGDKEGKAEENGEGDADGKEALDVAELYHAAANDCHIFCRKVDKKREKAALLEQRAAARERLKDEACSDPLQICWLGLQMAVMQEGVMGLLFPQEIWALKLVAQVLSVEDTRTAAVALCHLIEKGDDAVALEAAVAAWRERGLGNV